MAMRYIIFMMSADNYTSGDLEQGCISYRINYGRQTMLDNLLNFVLAQGTDCLLVTDSKEQF